MELKVRVKKQILSVKFPPNVDYHRVAQACAVHDSTAWYWIKTGNVPEKHVKILQKVPMEQLIKREKKCAK